MSGINSPAALKKSLRSQMRAELKTLEQRALAGTDAARILRESALYQNADLVLSYVALGNEFDTGVINTLVLADGKRLALPRINTMNSTIEADMDFFLVNPAIPLEKQLVKNRYGIWELRQDINTPPVVRPAHQPAIMLVPGLAFSRNGNRLGRGKGYYDRYLNSFSETAVVRVGVCFECQLLEDVPVEVHDRRMGWVLTEMGMRECISSFSADNVFYVKFKLNIENYIKM